MRKKRNQSQSESAEDESYDDEEDDSYESQEATDQRDNKKLISKKGGDSSVRRGRAGSNEPNTGSKGGQAPEESGAK